MPANAWVNVSGVLVDSAAQAEHILPALRPHPLCDLHGADTAMTHDDNGGLRRA